LRACVGRPTRFARSKRISQALAETRPLMELTTVLLPDPLGPSKSIRMRRGCMASPRASSSLLR
jgi:hypothetical protein